MTDSKKDQFLLFSSYFLSGFALLSLELLWGRMTALTLSSSVYSFSITLASVMGGILVGTYYGGRMSRRPSYKKYFMALALFSVTATITSIIFLYQSEVLLFLKFALPVPFKVTYYLTFFFIGLLILIPSAFGSAAFPIAVQLLVRDVQEAGYTAGKLYRINTIGAIIGCLLTGFVFTEVLGLKITTLICSLMLLPPAILYFITTKDKIFTTMLTLAFFLLTFLGYKSNFPELGFSIYVQKRFVSKDRFEQYRNAQQLLAEYENKFGIVRVLRGHGAKRLQINNKNESSYLSQDFPTQALLAILPIAYMSRIPDTFMSVGLGTGTTVNIASQFSKTVDSIEINPNVYKAVVEHFIPELKDNPRVNHIFDEAKHHLLSSNKRYDIISLEPSYPTDMTTASLYTKETLESIKEDLADDGLLCFFAPLHVIGEHYTEGVLKTIATVFPYTHTWVIDEGSDILFIASKSPLPLGPNTLLTKLNLPPFSNYNLASHLRFSKQNLRVQEILSDEAVPIYTDNKIILELAAVSGLLEEIGSGRMAPEMDGIH